jgi:acetyl esterase/lipase
MMRKLTIVFFFAITLVSCQRETGIDPNESLAAQTYSNISYGSDPAQKMDLYLPAGRTDTTKMIIMVHGGGWVEGDKSDFAQFVPVLKQRFPGWAIANINYRLATAVANYFPAQETDMKAAVDYLVQKGSEYHISEKFVLLGASAGAHMALLQAYKYSSPKIKAVVDFFGPADMVSFFNTTTDPTLQIGLQILMGGTPASNPAMYQQSSPVNFVDGQSPPTIILHGDMDLLVDISQSQMLRDKLQTAGVTNEFETYQGYGHDIWPDAVMEDAFDRIENFIKTNVH